MAKGALVLGIALALLATAPPTLASSPKGVDKYRAFFAQVLAPSNGTHLVVLRSLRRSGQKLLLAVDPEALTTQLLPEEGLRLHRLSWTGLRKAITHSPYGRAIGVSEKNSSVMQDAGLVHALPPGKGVVLTIDLCPSLRPLDRRLFRAILDNFEPEERPVPLGIAITGVWMLEHPIDLDWLRQLERDGEVAVTWINHSFHHRFAPELPLSKNFLLKAGTDADGEVLKTEAAMIENGLLPSVFFRFPGLVSDRALMRRVISYGLIPV